jgi:hypothetical protein
MNWWKSSMYLWMNGKLMEYYVVNVILKKFQNFIQENMLELIYQMIKKNRFESTRIFVFI